MSDPRTLDGTACNLASLPRAEPRIQGLLKGYLLHLLVEARNAAAIMPRHRGDLRVKG